MRAGFELACYPEQCILCGACAAACPEAASGGGPVPQVDRGRCTACGKCAKICPAAAMKLMGREYSREELLELLLRDRHFYTASGGGVTFSGGEPTLCMEYLGNALEELQAIGVHTAIQTCGLFAYERFARRVLPFVDLIMFDLKFIDPAKHKQYTGRDNALILENFQRLTEEASSRLLPRVPLVPGVTATPGNLLNIASFLAGQGHARCDLLSYNPAGTEKRRAIGMDLPSEPMAPHPDRADEDRLRRLFQERFMQCIETAA
jgi:pyruvate formate lyase activating enzyme